MSGEAGLLERLAQIAGDVLSPLRDRLIPEAAYELFEKLGLRLPTDFLTSGAAASALAQAAGSAQSLASDVAALRDAIEAADSNNLASIAAMVDAGRRVITAIGSTVAAIKALATAMEAGTSALPAVERDTVTEFLATFHRRLLDYLLLDYVDGLRRGTGQLLALTGVFEDRLDHGSRDDLLLIPHQLRRVHYEKFGKFLRDPKVLLAEVYGLEEPGFDGVEFLGRVAEFIERYGQFTLHPGVDGRLELSNASVTLAVAPDPDDPVSPDGVMLSVWQPAVRDWTETRDLGGNWSLVVDARARFEAGLAAGVFLPKGKLVIEPPVGEAHGDISFGLRAARGDGQPMTLVGLAGGTRLEIDSVDIRAGASFASTVFPGRAEIAPAVQCKFDGLRCILDLGGGDGFAKSLSGGGRGKSDVSLDARWSPASGLQFTGSAALEVAIPAHARMGPATIETVYLVGGLADDAISLELSAALRGQLGPFTAVVDRVGVTLTATFPEDGGNLGPVQLDPAFKPPSGVGLSVDGGGFSGGGFLRRDPANGEYGGALELSFQDVIDVKAFGIINTRLPDGSDTFSLAIVISAEFAPIQLGFGFTLLGIGGLLGVNRTALYDQLRLGLRDGSMNSILFPTNLVANAPRIINDLKRLFPPQQGRFLIGPMAKLGWGTPSIITLDLGLILEIPRPGFALLGILRMTLPAKEAAILELQVNFLGVVDFERKEISFDASLFDSRLLAFTLTGDMALRIYWGENANFLMTVGGFHPDYVPPPLDLPALNRLAISMWAGNPRLSAEAYFAVTSNTVQFGAKVELYYGVKIFNVYGFIGLDALIQFEPFYLIAKVAGQVAVRSGGSTLFAIRLEMTLEGPSPWHAHGTGSFEIGFIFTVTISAGFDITFGEKRNTSLPPVQLRTLLEDSLRSDGSWRVLSAGRPHIATRDLTASPELVVSPTGSLAVAQKAAPLNLALARVGVRRVDGANRFQIVDVSLGPASDPPATVPAFEQFAAAQYLDLSDAERLSRRSFEPLEAGVEIAGGTAPRADAQTNVDVAYEVIYVRKPRRRILFWLRDTLLDALLGGSAAARSKLAGGQAVPTGIGTPKVVVPVEQFVIAGVNDLNRVGGAFSSQTAAHAALQDKIANDPSLSGKLQVVPAFEATAFEAAA